MELTIEKVYPKPRTWEGKYGPSAAVKVLFADASEGDYLTKPDKAQEHIDLLTALVGKSSEFEVEAKPEYNGVQQWKIVSYPGKPQGWAQGGGGGRQYTPRYTDTAEGFTAEQRAMNARTALMQAVEYMTDSPTAQDVLNKATDFFQWLQHYAFFDSPNTARSNGQNATQGQSAPSEGTVEANPRDRFFAQWRELNLPDVDEYMRYVIHRILLQKKEWPENLPLNSVEDVDDEAWTVAAKYLHNYSTMLARKKIKPGEEPEFVAEEEEA